jgi:PhoH-like ATPase
MAVPAGTIDRLFSEKQIRLKWTRAIKVNEFVLMKDETGRSESHPSRGARRWNAVSRCAAARAGVWNHAAKSPADDGAGSAAGRFGETGVADRLGRHGQNIAGAGRGMAKTLNEEVYQKLLCARPIMPLGRDIGYLPGDKDEKLTAWMQPIFDNMRI